MMSTRLSWSPAQSTLAVQASKGLHVINNLNYKCNYSFKASCELFDKCVVPILTYGSEIWGPYYHSSIENVLLKFCKKQLGVGSKAPSPAVLGECGRHSILIDCYTKCIKYWLKLINLPVNSLLRSCYNFLYSKCNLGAKNWASKIKMILFQFGFGYIWESQSVLNHGDFVIHFRKRLIDCDTQTWHTNMLEMPKLNLYRMFKTTLSTEKYLLLNLPRRLQVALTKFRISCHDFEIEIGRRYGVPKEDRLCKLCILENLNRVEDEFHVIFVCNAYRDYRQLYFDADQTQAHNMYSLIKLLRNTQELCITRLANFLCCVSKVRSIKLA